MQKAPLRLSYQTISGRRLGEDLQAKDLNQAYQIVSRREALDIHSILRQYALYRPIIMAGHLLSRLLLLEVAVGSRVRDTSLPVQTRLGLHA